MVETRLICIQNDKKVRGGFLGKRCLLDSWGRDKLRVWTCSLRQQGTMGVVCHEAQEVHRDLEETAVFKVCLATVCAASVRGSQREEGSRGLCHTGTAAYWMAGRTEALIWLRPWLPFPVIPGLSSLSLWPLGNRLASLFLPCPLEGNTFPRPGRGICTSAQQVPPFWSLLVGLNPGTSSIPILEHIHILLKHILLKIQTKTNTHTHTPQDLSNESK